MESESTRQMSEDNFPVKRVNKFEDSNRNLLQKTIQVDYKR